MAEDKITIVAAPAPSIEESHGIKIVDSFTKPSLGVITTQPARAPVRPKIVANVQSAPISAIRIIKPTLAGAVWSYTTEKDVTPLLHRAEWDFSRIGGLGSFWIQLAGAIRTDAATWAGSRYEVEISVKLPDDASLAVWYRGIIESMHVTAPNGGDSAVVLEGGSYLAELRKIRVDRNFAAGTTVRSMIETILDSDVVGANSRILKNTAKLISIADSYTSADIVGFTHSGYDAARILADLQGSIEWGIDAAREFYFLTASVNTNQNKLLVGKDIGLLNTRTNNYQNFTAVNA